MCFLNIVRDYGIVFFTALLVLVGFLQVYWMKRTLSEATATNKATQRAFVFLQSFETTIIGDKLRIHPKWENSGTTPTRRMRNHVNWKAFSEDPPDGYTFPDL